MIRTYPLQVLLALTGLGLLIGLPSLERPAVKAPIIAQARGGASGCLAAVTHTRNVNKPETRARMTPSVNTAYDRHSAISNPVVSEKTQPHNKMRQPLRQCA